jgi:hypothetical protein
VLGLHEEEAEGVLGWSIYRSARSPVSCSDRLIGRAGAVSECPEYPSAGMAQGRLCEYPEYPSAGMAQGRLCEYPEYPSAGMAPTAASRRALTPPRHPPPPPTHTPPLPSSPPHLPLPHRVLSSRDSWLAQTRTYPARHGIPPRHDMQHGMVSLAAWYPARHGIPHGMVSRPARVSRAAPRAVGRPGQVRVRWHAQVRLRRRAAAAGELAEAASMHGRLVPGTHGSPRSRGRACASGRARSGEPAGTATARGGRAGGVRWFPLETEAGAAGGDEGLPFLFGLRKAARTSSAPGRRRPEPRAWVWHGTVGSSAQ